MCAKSESLLHNPLRMRSIKVRYVYDGSAHLGTRDMVAPQMRLKKRSSGRRRTTAQRQAGCGQTNQGQHPERGTHCEPIRPPLLPAHLGNPTGNLTNRCPRPLVIRVILHG